MMRGTGGFSIVLLMVGGVLILISMFEAQPWLDAPKVVAPATISHVIGCDTIEGDRICQTKIQRPGKVPQIVLTIGHIFMAIHHHKQDGKTLDRML
jgi:hypothetical protein